MPNEPDPLNDLPEPRDPALPPTQVLPTPEGEGTPSTEPPDEAGPAGLGRGDAEPFDDPTDPSVGDATLDESMSAVVPDGEAVGWGGDEHTLVDEAPPSSVLRLGQGRPATEEE